MREKKLQILYITTMAVAVISSNFIVCAISVLWCMVALAIYLRKNGNKIRYGNKFGYAKFIYVYFLFPTIIIHLYTMVLILFGITDINVLSSNMLTYLPILLTIASIYLFHEKVLMYDFIIIIMAWVAEAVIRINKYGSYIIISSIKSVFGCQNAVGFFEVNDIVHAVGYVWLFYLFSSYRTRKNIARILVPLAIIFILGFKRIGLLAVIGTTLYYIILPKNNIKLSYRICRIVSVVICFFGIGYIWILGHTQVFENILTKYNIDTLSRNIFYRYIIVQTTFSPTFLGYGRGSVKIEMLNIFHNFSHVHSDIVKMFYEIGLIPFLIWITFYFSGMLKIFKKKFNAKSAIFYSFVAAYTFILYLTDNTEAYFVCRLIRTTMPVVYAVCYSNLSTEKLLSS